MASDTLSKEVEVAEVPWLIFLQHTKKDIISFAFLVALSSLLTVFFARVVEVKKDFFYTGLLSPGQIMAFLCGFTVIIWWACAGVGSLLCNSSHARAEATDLAESTEAPDAKDTSIFRLSKDAKSALDSAALFTAIIFVFFFCDRTTFFHRESKMYDEWQFWGLWALLMAVAAYTFRRAQNPEASAASPTKQEQMKNEQKESSVVPMETDEKEKPSELSEDDFHVKWLQRDQTEEWKGWMQIMFLWYHYFEAKPLYNAIRIYIAAYVWMTGFGNFSYYYIRKDFTLARFCQMQWRLNFLVIWVCLILRNEYMLYYINMLHTTFTVFIYAALGIKSSMQSTVTGTLIKFALVTAISLIIWDVNGVFDVVWAPFTWLVQYHDPYKPERDIMHEWKFRSGLDHLVWIVGMATAYCHPNIDNFFQKIDAMPNGRSIKMFLSVVLAIIMFVYYQMVFSLPKMEYNVLHPFTSFIPITCYILFRNLFRVFRRWHMHLFEWCGKITLETYIGQFHIWMLTTGINGSPKKLLRIVPGPIFLSFVITSIILIWCSLRLFETTVALKSWVLPAKVSNSHLQRNIVNIAVFMSIAYGYSRILHNFSYFS